jgi:hypothetical protein
MKSITINELKLSKFEFKCEFDPELKFICEFAFWSDLSLDLSLNLGPGRLIVVKWAKTTESLHGLLEGVPPGELSQELFDGCSAGHLIAV